MSALKCTTMQTPRRCSVSYTNRNSVPRPERRGTWFVGVTYPTDPRLAWYREAAAMRLRRIMCGIEDGRPSFALIVEIMAETETGSIRIFSANSSV